MSLVKQANESDFDAIVGTEGITVVDFWAEWCGPCKMFSPIFEKSANDNPHITHAKVNVDDNPGLAQTFGIQSIPTTVFIREGIVVGSVSGALSAGRLEDLIQQTFDLDMKVVRDSAGKN